ncbi:MAG: DNA polymerase III subunit beta [Gaiella sp.]
MVETGTDVGGAIAFSCSRDELQSRIATVARAVAARGAVQVLSGVLISGQEGSLQLAATDMELSLRTGVSGVELDGDGALVVPGKLLVDMSRLLPGPEVTFRYRPEDGRATITSGPYTSNVNVFAAEDFPRLPSVDVPMHTIAAPALLDTIDRVARAASKDDSRPVLTGILVRFEGSSLVMAATDSYRMAVKETALETPGPELEAIIPARALTELTRLAAGAETVEIGVHDNHVVFGVNDVWLTTRRIDGQFPNHKQLIPDTFEAELDLPRAEFLEVVRRAGVMAQRNSPLRLRFAEGELTVQAQSQDVGETRESLPAPYTGEPLEIGFNAEFLREGLESVPADTVKLRLISPLRPGLLLAPEASFSYLIMPIRLAG